MGVFARRLALLAAAPSALIFFCECFASSLVVTIPGAA